MHLVPVLIALVASLQANDQIPRYSETLDVKRTVFTVRLVDAYGKPMLGLQPPDFVAHVGGKPADVLFVTWVPETPHGRKLAGEPELDAEFLDALAKYEDVAPASPGRLFVLYFQTDFARNSVRLSGQMNAMFYVDRILDSLLPEDRVAVLSFDSHLRFHLDFTTDRRQIRDAARRTLRIQEPPAPPPVPEPSLAQCLDRAGMRRATKNEQALRLLARALHEIPGEKQLIFVGTGMGIRSPGMVEMDREWNAAKQELRNAAVTLNAIYAMAPGTSGQLAAGLRAAALQTGGFFVRADFQGLKRVEEGELTGKYEIEVRIPPELPPGTHPVAIRGTKRKDIVLDGTITITVR